MRNLLRRAGLATSVRTCEAVLAKVVSKSVLLIANELIATAAIATESIATESTAAIATESTAIEAIATVATPTEMTGTVIEEAIVIADVTLIRATVTQEAGHQRLLHCNSSLSRHLPCVVEMTGTGIVLGMLGPGKPFSLSGISSPNFLMPFSGTRSLPDSLHHLPTMTGVEVVMGTGVGVCVIL
jgi:hypothetical protein